MASNNIVRTTSKSKVEQLSNTTNQLQGDDLEGGKTKSSHDQEVSNNNVRTTAKSELKQVTNTTNQLQGDDLKAGKTKISQDQQSDPSIENLCNSVSVLSIEEALGMGPKLNEDKPSEEIPANLEKKTSDLGIEKSSSVSAKVSDGTSSLAKTSSISKIESGKSSMCSVSKPGSGKSSMCRGSSSSDMSDGSSYSYSSSSISKPHKGNDVRWEAIQVVRSSTKDGVLGLPHFRLLKKLGCGDIGSVYLAELSGTKCYFAMKVMDKVSLESRKKLLRAQTEREILQSLDHPFLPTLYAHFETDKFSCLVMEFCPGGDLHTLRQRQPGKHFTEQAVKFYIAEVLLSLEYLHMLGIIYRDLKPENVLVREDGHIMLSDFDLSLRCVVNPTVIRSSSTQASDPLQKNPVYCVQPACIEPSCITPSCVVPTTCFSPRLFSSKSKKEKKSKNDIGNQVRPLPELIAEPTSARSMSFVGTHEYLAPEIIKGEGHGSAVDWWTFGIFLYELLFGKTPFKGSGNRATLFNVVGQPLRFPETPMVSFAARDLIRGLLVKEPQHRLAYKRGATEIKQHAFFEGVNWALIRCATPPDIPTPVDFERIPTPPASTGEKKAPMVTAAAEPDPNYLEFDFF